MRGRKRAGRVRWVAAASVAVLLSAVAYLYEHRQLSQGTDPGWQSLSVAAITPPGGGQKAIVLPDGSKVWLNAGSTLRYPPHFPEGQRVVALDGEAFFDVAGTAERPFRVRIRDAEIEVLGTYFDVMAYADEPTSRTTLVSGGLKVTSGHQSEVLHPGEAAIVVHPSAGVEGNLVVQSGIDTNIVMDWKAGIYRFQGTDLRTILRVLGRNYNLKIHYQPGTPDPSINGSLDLHRDLKFLLEQLESILASHKIHLTIDDEMLTVSSD